MKKLAIASALLASLATLNMAHAYQTEVYAGLERTNVDSTDINPTAIALSGKYYITPVNVRNAPLAEAAFLDKASHVALGYTNLDLDVADADVDLLGLSGEYYVPNSNFYASAAINRADANGEKGNGYALEVGYLPMAGMLLAVGATDMSESADPILTAKYGTLTSLGAVASAGNDTAATLRAKYVTKFGTNDVNFEGNILIGDETAYRVGADLYLDPTLSIGASIADSTFDDSDAIFGLRAQKFITPVVAVGGSYTTVDGADSFGLNLTGRF
ncbi:MAG: putative porin [Pseudomonadota bacterium]|nr:putative porin [Pseudomonadota bacterium]